MAGRKKSDEASPRARKARAPTPESLAQTPPDPTADEALLALPEDMAAVPDITVEIATRELASLARLAGKLEAPLRRRGVSPAMIATLARFARRLRGLEKAWQKTRARILTTPGTKKLRREAEQLKRELLDGAAWACRQDATALAELARIRLGSGLADTLQDLRDLVDFWSARPAAMKVTDVTPALLARATELAGQLTGAAREESLSAEAARALELRNRCFWAANDLAAEVRLGGRYAFRKSPKVAVRFASRFRLDQLRVARQAQGDKSRAAAPRLPPAPGKNAAVS